jgi:hypothetical protein
MSSSKRSTPGDYKKLDSGKDQYDFSVLPQDEKELQLYLKQAVTLLDSPLKSRAAEEDDITTVLKWEKCFEPSFIAWVETGLNKLKPKDSIDQFLKYLGVSWDDFADFMDCHFKKMDPEVVKDYNENKKNEIPNFRKQLNKSFHEQCDRLRSYVIQFQNSPEFRLLHKQCDQLRSDIKDGKLKLEKAKADSTVRDRAGILFKIELLVLYKFTKGSYTPPTFMKFNLPQQQTTTGQSVVESAEPERTHGLDRL